MLVPSVERYNEFRKLYSIQYFSEPMNHDIVEDKIEKAKKEAKSDRREISGNAVMKRRANELDRARYVCG